MTTGDVSGGPRNKNQRRESAREKSKAIREQRQRKDRLGRVLLQGGLIVGSLAIIAIVALVIINSQRPAGPGPRNMMSDGIKITEGLTAVPTAALAADDKPVPNPVGDEADVIDIQIYVDYLCPYCNDFETTNAEQLEAWIERGAATVEVHPISILNSNSQGTQYSTRSANAAACVANYSPDTFWKVNTALFANQPEERTPGLSDEELIKVLADAGAAPMADIERCVRDQTFKAWVQASTLRALDGPVPNSEALVKGTPTVVVNGLKYEGAIDDAEAFSAFVVQAAGASFTENSTPTPTPTPAS